MEVDAEAVTVLGDICGMVTVGRYEGTESGLGVFTVTDMPAAS